MIRRFFRSLVASLFVAASLPAQAPPPAVPTPFVRPPISDRPAVLPAPNNAANDMVRLQFPNSDVGDVLRYYESLTGKKLVIDNNVQGKVNIFLSKSLPRDEAIRIIELNLSLNGFSMVPVEGDIMEVVGIGKNPRAAAVPIFSDPADLPSGGKVVSFLFKLRYADPQELQSVLSQYMAGLGGQAPILSLPKSSSLLVTQSADVIRKLVKMVEQLDVEPAEVKSEFIKLERADASKVVDMLKDIFEKGGQPGQYNPGARNIRGIVPPPPGVPQQADSEEGTSVLSEESLVVGKIKLEADVRTNRIHVITRPINLPFIRELIAQFDANVEFGKPVTRPLKYIAAGDVLDVLVQALTEPGENQAGGQGGGPGQPQPGRTPARNPTAPTGQYPTGGTSGAAGESTLTVNEELSTAATDTTPKAITVGNTKLIADARANSIIVLGNREVVVKVEKILDEMDVKAPQVALSTVIGELTLNNNEEFGVDYFLQFKPKNLTDTGGVPVGVGGGLNTGTVPSTNILDPASLITFPVFSTLPSGATAYLAAGNTLAAIVNLLDSTGRFKTISRPTVFTSNNKKAIIASGQEIPVPVNTISSATGSSIINTGLAQQSNIEYKKVALQLEVVPLINSEKEVSLDILQKLDSLAAPTVINGNSIPTISTRYIRTSVSAPNGSTIVLGGLITDEKTRNRTGFPILDRIPIIGSLFSDTIKSKKRTELIVLMRPEVTLTKLDLYRLREKSQSKTHFGSELDQEEVPISTGKELPPPDLPESK